MESGLWWGKKDSFKELFTYLCLVFDCLYGFIVSLESNKLL